MEACGPRSGGLDGPVDAAGGHGTVDLSVGERPDCERTGVRMQDSDVGARQAGQEERTCTDGAYGNDQDSHDEELDTDRLDARHEERRWILKSCAGR